MPLELFICLTPAFYIVAGFTFFIGLDQNAPKQIRNIVSPFFLFLAFLFSCLIINHCTDSVTINRPLEVVIVGNVATLDLDGNIINLNKRFERNFKEGNTSFEIIGENTSFFGMIYSPQYLIGVNDGD